MGKQFSEVSSKYGAPMGRREDGFIETDMPRFVRLYRVRIDSGGYDDGGAYWGLGAPLYCAEDDDGNRKFTRASGRAMAALILGIPSPALKKPLYKHEWINAGLSVIDGKAPMPAGESKSTICEWLRRCGAHTGQETGITQ